MAAAAVVPPQEPVPLSQGQRLINTFFALAAIGISCVSKVKMGTAFAVVFGWFAFLLLIGIGFTAFS